jgi:asparagine synthase (glutamine-hydrolysing)
VSGIAAVWRRDGAPLERATLERMTARLAPRTPDGLGLWLDGPLGLAHRALHTTTESRAQKLPLASETAEVALTADARLDNHEDLIAALALTDRAAVSLSDAELILHAWTRWGEDCPARLLGDFTFVLWDARRRVLFCARDPAGVRPLYYHLGPRLFAVASETKALFALPDMPRRLDEIRLAAYLVPGLDDRVATFFESIHRLPAGHSLTVSATGGTPRAYWQPDPTRAIGGASDGEYAEAFRELFTESARGRLRSDSPVAAALSGGLDSSSVVCVARAIRAAGDAGPLATYTARFPTIPRCDEEVHVAAVEGQGGLVPHHLRGDTLDPLGDVETTPGREDETFHAPGYYMHGALYRAARVDGAGVFLEGTGGDLVVSHGTGHLHGLARQWRWVALGREIHKVSRSFGRRPWRTLRGVAAAVAPGSLQRAYWRLQRLPLVQSPPIRADFARRIGLDEHVRAAAAAAPTWHGADVDEARREHWRTLTSPRLAAILETVAALGGAVGVDVRDPFLDRRLMEFCLALPASQKIRDGRTRVVLRHALGSVLPPEVRDRPGKAPLDLMLGAALAVYGRERLARLMDDATRVLAPYVPAETIRRAHRRYLARGSPRDVSRVWRIAMVTLWLRRAML